MSAARRPRWSARVRPRVLEIVWLTLVWVLLWGTFTPLSIVGGVVVAVAVIGAFRFPPAEAHLPSGHCGCSGWSATWSTTWSSPAPR